MLARPRTRTSGSVSHVPVGWTEAQMNNPDTGNDRGPARWAGPPGTCQFESTTWRVNAQITRTSKPMMTIAQNG